MALSTLVFGMFAALAFWITALRRELVAGSGPPDFTAITISLPMRVKVFAIELHRFIFRAFLNSNALPIRINYLKLQNYGFSGILRIRDGNFW
ncbi:hypothetical protein D9M70_636210 [compost metagenome]